MPVTPTYPGVYIEEVPSGVRTITGVSTSVAAFFGRTSKGPMNKAVRVLSYSDYERNFGDPHSKSDLATAVRLFFQNGGTQCYVVRLAKKETTVKASVNLKNEAGVEVLKLVAKDPGSSGNELSVQVKYNIGNPEAAFDLSIFRIQGGGIVGTEGFTNLSMDKSSPRYAPEFITQNSRLVDGALLVDDGVYATAGPGYSLSRRPIRADTNTAFCNVMNGLFVANSVFGISVDGSPFFDVDLKNITVEPGAGVSDAIGGAVGKIDDAIDDVLPAGLSVDVEMVIGPQGKTNEGETFDTKLLKISSHGTEMKSVVIRQGSDRDLAAPMMLGIEQGGIEQPRYAEFRPAPNGLIFKLSELNNLAGQDQDTFNTVMIAGQSVPVQLVTSDSTHKWYRDNPAGSITGNSDGVREKLGIIAKAINDAGIGWSAEVWGYRLALLAKSGINNLSSPLKTGPDDVGDLWMSNVRLYSLGSGGTGLYQGGGVNGLDGDAPGVNDYIGSEVDHTGFYALDLADLFNLMVIPGDSDLSEADHRRLWAPASTYCKSHRAFLIIDSPDSWCTSYSQVVDPSTGINKMRVGAAKDSCAVFYPKLRISDNGLTRTVGAGGALAGLMARTDSVRGVWKAPAGTDADLREIEGLSLILTDQENGVLNKQGVNCMRLFPSGAVNWGARTLDGADDFSSEWKYIPIRRLAFYLEESLYRGTKWVVFEPNDEPLWAQIRLNIGAFMHSLFVQGAFAGVTPRDAYFVKCDKETTTQDDINKGMVNIVVGFAPLKPAEFVIIKIQQIAGQILT
jgi:hypothetical protein